MSNELEWSEKFPPEWHKKREAGLQAKYGLSSHQWGLMFTRQKGKCPICLLTIYPPGTPHRRTAPVDHDHGPSKRVRGLLCFSCNRYRVGRNTVETAERMVKYLKSRFDGRRLK